MTDDQTPKWDVFGDFSEIVIADRVGWSIEGTVPSLFASGTPYAGETHSGLVEYWRQRRDDDA